MLIWASSSFAAVIERKEEGYFSGRIVRLLSDTHLLRVKTDFSNLKYLNKGNQLFFWGEQNPGKECIGTVTGKSNDHVLIKIKNTSFCKSYGVLATGAWTKFYSDDLVKNLSTGKDLYQVLLKKQVAVSSLLNENKNTLDSYIDKFEAVNQRYIVLREKLEAEWKKELINLETDRTETLANFKSLEMELDNIDKKLEQYRIEDENLRTDRWSLDPDLYYRK